MALSIESIVKNQRRGDIVDIDGIKSFRDRLKEFMGSLGHILSDNSSEWHQSLSNEMEELRGKMREIDRRLGFTTTTKATMEPTSEAELEGIPKELTKRRKRHEEKLRRLVVVDFQRRLEKSIIFKDIIEVIPRTLSYRLPEKGVDIRVYPGIVIRRIELRLSELDPERFGSGRLKISNRLYRNFFEVRQEIRTRDAIPFKIDYSDDQSTILEYLSEEVRSAIIEEHTRLSSVRERKGGGVGEGEREREEEVGTETDEGNDTTTIASIDAPTSDSIGEDLYSYLLLLLVAYLYYKNEMMLMGEDTLSTFWTKRTMKERQGSPDGSEVIMVSGVNPNPTFPWSVRKIRGDQYDFTPEDKGKEKRGGDVEGGDVPGQEEEQGEEQGEEEGEEEQERDSTGTDPTYSAFPSDEAATERGPGMPNIRVKRVEAKNVIANAIALIHNMVYFSNHRDGIVLPTGSALDGTAPIHIDLDPRIYVERKKKKELRDVPLTLDPTSPPYGRISESLDTSNGTLLEKLRRMKDDISDRFGSFMKFKSEIDGTLKGVQVLIEIAEDGVVLDDRDKTLMYYRYILHLLEVMDGMYGYIFNVTKKTKNAEEWRTLLNSLPD